MAEVIFGRWAVLETLRAARRSLQQLILAEGVEERGVINDILAMAEERGLPIKRIPRRMMDDLARGGNHQGVVLRVGEYQYAELEQIFQLAEAKGEKPFVLLLDLLQDPQNVGTLLRTADAVGVHGVVLQDRRGVGITPAVVNASSGATEHLNIVQVTNLVQTMKRLKEQGLWLAGLDVAPNILPIDRADLNIALGLVLGSEGEGMRRLVRDTCDLLLTLPMRGHVESLNVATAGAVALYAAWQARGWQGWAHADRAR
ncbi:MAG: 23S rRNA (guanosine(2251)-2'-O)-methyltransferase RlmB [Candidatus Thermofonsia Clade 1 bacterium]|jgi:23S rRNA (guanosine2251-2'-O)-methyltransferase|uniref:23S rRNA (Guanosine(2251)-2'-O)-methyltransferase RlmB n=1 Tax=Candidatus Thermofonsia Clade 1 bacterium TaxID=2364210 RepID=A0A2M8PBQ7_9CHLR|nr:MAG: 23S rRNA (guanosine(2251)-2'-O)-methyltransferase RlmB [Candidatus Thermofonsia Clade 1 bacterium]RMF51540.1 MAG: 23S rRNA (guanosine(2251)-2'-O)-methyltransferase RlmB [Chloroflexota bacterium]